MVLTHNKDRKLPAHYTAYVVEVTTGRLVGELPLVNVVAKVSLMLGEFSADLPMTVPPNGSRESAAQRFDRGRAQLRHMLAICEPGKYSVVLDRDGVPLGEWIIWRRSRPGGDVVKLIGAEFKSILGTCPMPVTGRKFTDVDQLRIATSLARELFNTDPGGVAVDVPEAPTSLVLRRRTYPAGDGAYVLQRINEIANVTNGFDWWIEPSWTVKDNLRYLRRTLRFGYERAGREQDDFIFESPGPGGSGGNIAGFSMDEDGTMLASETIAWGAGEGSSKVVGRASDPTLVANGWPRMTRSTSHPSVIRNAEARSKAQAELALSQSSELPPTMIVRADQSPTIGDWQLGDRVWSAVEPRWDFPDGYIGKVRVLGWTYTPKPGPELVALEITSMTDAPSGDGEAG